jgi:hypothetical protein
VLGGRAGDAGAHTGNTTTSLSDSNRKEVLIEEGEQVDALP